MFIALNKNKERITINEALTNEKYYCQCCSEELIQKKGPKRCHHFAHKPNGMCSESKYSDKCEWHNNWQGRFPKENIEVIKKDENGKKHIADVLIKNTEIEFQHSYMPFDEFNDRNEFYNKFNYHVIWVFDGNDKFDKGYNGGPFPFSKRFECLKHLKRIPNYLDIFIEGRRKNNLLDDYSGLYLHHVEKIDEKEGIIFNEKIYTIEDFIFKVNNDIPFNYKNDENDIKNEKKDNDCNNKYDKQTLLRIASNYQDADRLIVYNTKTMYSVLINRKNISRLIQGKKVYCKFKRGDDNSNFKYENEIYYVNEPIWTFQNCFYF